VIYNEQGLSGFAMFGNIFGAVGVLMGVLSAMVVSNGFAGL
jgi:hypothetical protein